MYFQVPKPTRAFNTTVISFYGAASTPAPPVEAMKGEPEGDGLFDFDRLPLEYQRGAIVDMLNAVPKVICSFYRRSEGLTTPKVSEMRQYLLRKTPGSVARGRQSIRNMKDDTPAAAWTLMRW